MTGVQQVRGQAKMSLLVARQKAEFGNNRSQLKECLHQRHLRQERRLIQSDANHEKFACAMALLDMKPSLKEAINSDRDRGNVAFCVKSKPFH